MFLNFAPLTGRHHQRSSGRRRLLFFVVWLSLCFSTSITQAGSGQGFAIGAVVPSRISTRVLRLAQEVSLKFLQDRWSVNLAKVQIKNNTLADYTLTLESSNGGFLATSGASSQASDDTSSDSRRLAYGTQMLRQGKEIVIRAIFPGSSGRRPASLSGSLPGVKLPLSGHYSDTLTLSIIAP